MNWLKQILELVWRFVRLLFRGIYRLVRILFDFIVSMVVAYWHFLRRRGWPTRIFLGLASLFVLWGIVVLARIPVPEYMTSQTGDRVQYRHVSRMMHMAPRPPSEDSRDRLAGICRLAADCGKPLADCKADAQLASDRACVELQRTCASSMDACSAGPEMTYQGWTEKDRMTYYYTSQGSAQVMFAQMRYDWFAELELPFSKDKFASPENMASFGFLVTPGQQADPVWNPGNLPVGFTRYYDPEIKAELLDVTCSLCHTGELHYTDASGSTTALRVDGGQAMHAVTSMQTDQFQSQMLQSLLATWVNPWKFDRFATQVFERRLGQGAARTMPDYEGSKAELKDRFGEMIGKLVAQAWFEVKNGIYPVLEGYGRIDAVQRIANTVFGRAIDPKNYKPGVAPVSYPHTWDIGKFDWVQYQGYASQPMARNINEALGVGARLDLFDDVGLPLPAHERFRTSVAPERLHAVESTLGRLTAPAWPESLWGKPDLQSASRGRALFDVHCRDCHGPHRGPAFPKDAEHGYKDPHVNVVLNYQKDETGKTYCTLGDEAKPISDQACLHLQNPQRLADAEGRRMFKLDEKGSIVDVCSKGDADCGASPEDVEEWRIFTLPLVAIGTDPTAAENLANQRYDGSRLALTAEDLKSACISNEMIETMDVTALNAIQGLNLLSLSIANRYFEDNPPESPEEMLKIMGFGILDYPLTDKKHLAGYKPRPLHGIWATPPFLHNGSVRTIYQLLSPVEERDAEFWVGTKEYDPVALGYRNEKIPGAILQSASTIGNSNSGHEFRTGCEKYGVIGPWLPPEDRWDIVEYLKVMDYVGDDELEAGLDASLVQRTRSDLEVRYPGYGTDAYYQGWQGHCSFEDPVYEAPKRPDMLADVIYQDSQEQSSCSLYELYLTEENDD